MVKITSANIVKDFVVRFVFSDGIHKEVDFMPFIAKGDFTKPLLEKEFFKQMRVYENGRGVFWPNGYDFCPDNLRYFVGNEETEVLKHFAVHDKPNNTKDLS